MDRETRPHTRRAVYRYLYSAGIFETCLRLYPFLGRRVFNAVAVTVAFCYALTQHGVRRIVRSNLGLLEGMPVSFWDAVRVFTNYGHTIADYVCAGGMRRREAMAMCSRQTGIEHVRAALAQERGAILATGHFGFFEFGTLFLSDLGYPVTVLTDAEPSPELTRWRAEFRRRWGAETLEVGTDSFAALEVVRLLNQGRFCAMLADRPLHGPSLRIAAPGGGIRFSTSPALFAYLADCPILPVAVRRLPQTKTYDLITKPCIHLDRSLPRPAALEKATRELAASLLEEFRAAPTQWYHFVPVGCAD